MVLCSQPQHLDDRKDTVMNPTLIVEVLSNSTERWDRVGKFTQYRRLASLKEYVLVTQDEMLIEWYTLRDNGEWVYREAHGPDAHCRLDSLDISIALASVYAGIEIVK
jgi:Uma2 family endonuclease